MDLSKETIQKSLLKFGVPPADLLVKYVALLMETNEMVNLTGAKTVDDFVLKHISDVWLAFKSIDGLSRPLIDVGSGGGLPGIPMAIFSPNTEVFLVERRVKKAMATESIVKGLGLQGRITVIPEALEIAKNKLPEEGECWLRGFLPGGKLATYLDEFFNPNTFWSTVLMKGPAWPQEKDEILALPRVSSDWKERLISGAEVTYSLPQDAGSRILVLV